MICQRNNMKNQLIEELTRLLIKQDILDKKKGKQTYIKKTTMFKDIIKLLKGEQWVKKKD